MTTEMPLTAIAARDRQNELIGPDRQRRANPSRHVVEPTQGNDDYLLRRSMVVPAMYRV
jgi:hypothetical protein